MRDTVNHRSGFSVTASSARLPGVWPAEAQRVIHSQAARPWRSAIEVVASGHVSGPFDGLAHEPRRHGVQPVCVVSPGRSGGPEASPAVDPAGAGWTQLGASWVRMLAAGVSAIPDAAHHRCHESRGGLDDHGGLVRAGWCAVDQYVRAGDDAIDPSVCKPQNAERDVRQEQVKQLRQEPREAYVQYWSSWNRFIHALRDLREMRHQEMPPDSQSSAGKEVSRQSQSGPGRPSATGGRRPMRCC